MDTFSLSTQEEFILLAIAILSPDAYAYSIKKELAGHFNHKLALGTIHTILYRLDRRGYLKSEMGGQDDRRGGRSKRLYSLSDKGQQIILDLKEAREMLWKKLAKENISLSKS